MKERKERNVYASPRLFVEDVEMDLEVSIYAPVAGSFLGETREAERELRVNRVK